MRGVRHSFLAVVLLLICGMASASARVLTSPARSYALPHQIEFAAYPAGDNSLPPEMRIGLFVANNSMSLLDPLGGSPVSLWAGPYLNSPAAIGGGGAGSALSPVGQGVMAFYIGYEFGTLVSIAPVIGGGNVSEWWGDRLYDAASGIYGVFQPQNSLNNPMADYWIRRSNNHGAGEFSDEDLSRMRVGLPPVEQLQRGFSGNYCSPVAPKVESREIVPYSGQLTPNSWPENAGFLGTAMDKLLPKGTLFDRHGPDTGTYVAPVGTPFPSRGLRPEMEAWSLNQYELLQPLKVKSGLSAPAFGYPGLGTQHQLPLTIRELLDAGV